MARNEKRVVLVTGANRGIGLEIARVLDQKGLCVVSGARSRKDVPKGADAVELDVTSDESVSRAVAEIVERFGRLDVLVNNAGILVDRTRPASSVSLDDVRNTFETNVIGAWRMTQAVLPQMRKQRYGRIVNLSSSMGSFADLRESGGGWSAYRISKTALNGLTVMFASELRGSGILVNACHPGWVRTDMGGSNADVSVEEGADTPVWLALLPDDGPSGGYFHERKPIDW